MQSENRPPSLIRQDSVGTTSSSFSSSSSGSHPKRARQPSLANIAVQSFAALRAQTSAILAPSPVRRKPLPPNASPVTTRFSTSEYTGIPKLGARGHQKRAFSLDTARPGGVSRVVTVLSPPAASPRQDHFEPRDLDKFPHGHTPLIQSPTDPDRPQTIPEETQLHTTLDSSRRVPAPIHPSRPRYDRSASSYHTAKYSLSESEGDRYYSNHSRSPTMTSFTSGTPNLTLQLDGVTNAFLDYDSESPDSAPAARHSRSPAQKFTSFFGWKSPQPHEIDSPTTTFSEKSLSPAPSPSHKKRQSSGPVAQGKPMPAVLDIPKANAIGSTTYFTVPGTPLLSTSPAMNAHVEELERELREVSTELANSIRREMELEDELERWKMEYPALSETGRRTSDYYSDSGASSVRFPIGDTELKLEELEKQRRQAEQERAQLKVEMATKSQGELRKRRDLEAQVHSLEEQLHSFEDRKPSVDEPNRVQELEAIADDLRRRLAEERQFKENFEDLLTALREELEQHRNQRDNLRDEVVPQLRARVEGLEAEAAEGRTLTYEVSRMQQEIETLRQENQALLNERRLHLELQSSAHRIKSIAEEDEAASVSQSPRVGLTRSNSLARSSVRNSRRGTLSRSSSVKERPESIVMPDRDRVKDIEEQRDALHKALQSLLKRQEYQAKQHAKEIRVLEMERDRALNATPRRTAFNEEVAHLREEVNHLRRRADDALEQKWQCEKGLGGLRMDLDRAEQETSSLRQLLQEHDIAVPEPGDLVPEIRVQDDTSPISLNRAYEELQTTHALSLAKIREMTSEGGLGITSEEAERTMGLLMQSISDAEAERDNALGEAEAYRQQARVLQQSEVEHLSKEQSLASELYASAQRMDDLASQVQQQLQSNKLLRQRLADAITRGEHEQQASASKINEMQGMLKALEDKMMAAQHHSEEIITRHEDEVKQLKESHHVQLQRMKSGSLSPGKPPSSPLSPLFLKSPRLDLTTTGRGVSMVEASKTEALQQKISSLEKALVDADKEMQEVVSRMNMAQIEVAELQAERDDAMRHTRKLQTEILAEREKVKALMS